MIPKFYFTKHTEEYTLTFPVRFWGREEEHISNRTTLGYAILYYA